MSATSAIAGIDKLTLHLNREIRVNASLENTFEALLEQLGPENETPEAKMPMKIEPWPGGRWFRDLGGNNGHYWATVQAIKRPELLELCGPLFMSNPVVNNIQYRLTKTEQGTLITFRHTALGFIPDEHREGMMRGWGNLQERIQRAAEKRATEKRK
ncbi:MAG: SRPBCC domain-containing protein [Terriglobales bacterium]|jgi:uncharacterized protein YndB with AHSA1/START domain